MDEPANDAALFCKRENAPSRDQTPDVAARRRVGYDSNDMFAGGRDLRRLSLPVTNDGCPTSRSFFARCGIPRLSAAHSPLATGLDVHDHLRPYPQGAEVRGIPHLAKNERDVGYPAFVHRFREAGLNLAQSKVRIIGTVISVFVARLRTFTVCPSTPLAGADVCKAL
jgi:hypothetical protein